MIEKPTIEDLEQRLSKFKKRLEGPVEEKKRFQEFVSYIEYLLFVMINSLVIINNYYKSLVIKDEDENVVSKESIIRLKDNIIIVAKFIKSMDEVRRALVEKNSEIDRFKEYMCCWLHAFHVPVTIIESYTELILFEIENGASPILLKNRVRDELNLLM